MRLLFLSLVAGCAILYQFELIDYIVLAIPIVLLVGIFSVSEVELTNQEIKIRKSYFWSLVSLQWSLVYSDVISIGTKDYAIDAHEDMGWFTEGILSLIFMGFPKTKIKWVTGKIYYRDKGVEKDIELKLTREEYLDIHRAIKPRTIYNFK